MRTVSIRLTLVLAVIFVMLCTSFIGVHNYQNTAYADSVSFDSTDVLGDLSSSTVNGQPFDIRNYPFDESKQTSLFSFVEYCYSFKANMRSNYGLYIYVYNPQGINFATNTQQNKIQMATEYSNGVPSRYEKFRLQYCGKVEDARYKGLFYKFKVIDRKIDGKEFVDRVNSNERRYDVSGVELLTYGKQNATEYGVGGTYKFTGYSKGYGPDAEAESTLNCDIEQLETCELEVHHTYFRTEGVSSLGSGHYNEVNTVYFELPNHFLRDYGSLQKIRAEWWEYKTQKMFVTSNRDFYDNYLLPYVGENDSTAFSMWYGHQHSSVSSGAPPFVVVNTTESYSWAYNIKSSSETFWNGSTDRTTVYSYSPNYFYAFYSPVSNESDVFSFLYSDPIAGDVSANVVQDWLYNYARQQNLTNYDKIGEGRDIPAMLFESSVDSGRTRGHNDITIDLEDTFNLSSYDSNHSWWDKLWDFGISWPSTSEEYHDVNPIVIVKASDLVGASSVISRNLLVNADDVSDIQAMYAHAILNDCSVVLFRFASTDYFCRGVGRDGVAESDADTYCAQETVFFDFDIIELTFNKDGEYTIIPVVASPIDVINGITAPPRTLDWWKLILAAILLIILLILLAPLLPYIIKAIIWLITLPFKAVKKLKRKKEVKNDDNS